MKVLTDKLFEELKTELPAVIFFHSTWCSSCGTAIKLAEKLESSYKDKFEFYSADTDTCYNVAYTCDIKSLPAGAIVKDKSVEETWSRNISAKELTNILNAYYDKK